MKGDHVDHKVYCEPNDWTDIIGNNWRQSVNEISSVNKNDNKWPKCRVGIDKSLRNAL